VNDTSEFRRDRAWQVVLAAAVGCAFSLSALPYYTLGMVAKPISEEFGWGRAVAQSGIAFASLGVLCSAWLAGAAIDRFGVRRVALASQAGLALGFVGFALQTGAEWLWYANWFLLALLGVGTTPITWSRGIAAWFDRSRGLALGLGLMGTGITAFAAPPLMTALVASQGWRTGYALCAAGIVLVALPTTWFLFRERAAVRDAGAGGAPAAALAAEAEGLTLGEALRGYRYWVIIAAFFLVSAAATGLISNLVLLLTDGGMGAAEAAGYASLLGGFVVVGRLTAGWLLDRLWAPVVALLVLAPTAIASLLLQAQAAPALAVAMIGLAGGAEFDLIAYLCAKYFGMRHYGKIYAWQWASFTAAAGAGPLVFGRIFDATGSYAVALSIAAIAMLAGPLLLFTLGRYPARADRQARVRSSRSG
jgi:MFS family permease